MSGTIPPMASGIRRVEFGKVQPTPTSKALVVALGVCAILAGAYLERDKLAGLRMTTSPPVARTNPSRSSGSLPRRDEVERNEGSQEVAAIPEDLRCFTPADTTAALGAGERNGLQATTEAVVEGESKDLPTPSVSEPETTHMPRVIDLDLERPEHKELPAQPSADEAIARANLTAAKPSTNDVAKTDVLEHESAAKAEPGEPAKSMALAAKPETSTGSPPGATPKPAPIGATTCILNVNSIPASRIALDGHEIGSTPKLGVAVTPRMHVVTFITDDAKKITSASCKAGEQKTVAMRLSE